MSTPSIEDLLPETKMKMQDAMDHLNREFTAVRTGKASPTLVETISVEYYGQTSKLRDIAGITAPEPRLLVIQPWDQSAVKSIEKAIVASDLGISPVSDGRVVRLPIPELSEERRKDMVKMVKNKAESARVEIRNTRRDANESAKKAEKASTITEDDLRVMTKDIQDLTDKFIAKIDSMLEEKEAELMQV